MKNIIKLLSFSNLWIGLAACLLGLSNLLSLRWLPNMEETQLSISGAKYMLVFILFACTFVYTAIRLLGLREKHPNASSEMIDYVRKYKVYLGIWAALCFSVAMYCFYHLFIVQILLIIFAGFLCAIYAMPLYKSNGEWRSLRQIPYIKTFIVALVWALLCVSCVMVYADMYPVMVRPQHILLFCMDFIFILALTIPFDIRDIDYDIEGNVKTIAQRIGIDNTKKLSIGLLISYMLLSFIFYIYLPCYIKYQVFFRSFNQAIYVMCFAAALASIFIVKKINKDSKESVFTFELDGMIIVQSIGVIAVCSIYYFFN